jgi:hypothetical protein
MAAVKVLSTLSADTATKDARSIHKLELTSVSSKEFRASMGTTL